VNVVRHTDGVFTRAGCQMPDWQMKTYNHKTKLYTSLDWATRDKPFEKIRSAMHQRVASSGSVHIIPELTPISDQGQVGSCVANSWCDMLEILDGLEGKDKIEQLSRLFLYWIARYYVGDEKKDDGTYHRAAYHQLSTIGVVEERHYPYKESAVFSAPELDLYTMASNNRIKDAYRLVPDSSSYLNDLELAIRANHPAVFGVDVSKAFMRSRSLEVFGLPSPEDEMVGGHAMIVVGVMYDGDQRRWLVRNSWGADWGGNGHTKFDDASALSWNDVWVGTRMGELI
jgi:C1A family cysteine protease